MRDPTRRRRPRRPRPVRIALVNRWAPPDAQPTGQAAAWLADALRAALPDARVTIHAARPGGGPPPRAPVRRLAGALVDAVRLGGAAALRADIVISLTDPPFLSLVLGLARVFRRFRWIEWVMDVYPRLFVACGMIDRRHPAARLAAALDRRVRPDHLVCCDAGQWRAVAQGRRAEVPATVLPFGLAPPTAAAPPPTDPRPLTLLYAGTLGHAHAPEALIALIERGQTLNIRFQLSLTGVYADQLHRARAVWGHVDWAPPGTLAWSALAAADAHIVCLRPEAADLSVPSKAITAVTLGRPVVWIGPETAAIWRRLAPAGWRIDPACHESLDQALGHLSDPADRRRKTEAAQRLGAALRHEAHVARDRLIRWVCAAAGEVAG